MVNHVSNQLRLRPNRDTTWATEKMVPVPALRARKKESPILDAIAVEPIAAKMLSPRSQRDVSTNPPVALSEALRSRAPATEAATAEGPVRILRRLWAVIGRAQAAAAASASPPTRSFDVSMPYKSATLSHKIARCCSGVR